MPVLWQYPVEWIQKGNSGIPSLEDDYNKDYLIDWLVFWSK